MGRPRLHPEVEAVCPCGDSFTTDVKRLEQGRGKYCSKDCKYKYRTRPTGLVYNITKENPTWFKPGHTPWSLGLKGIHMSRETEIKQGQHLSPRTEFKKGHTLNEEIDINHPTGEDHPLWLGDDVGYEGLHGWVKRHKQKTGTCSDCGTQGPTDWSNQSQKYYRDLDDFIERCRSCHRQYDLAHPDSRFNRGK